MSVLWTTPAALIGMALIVLPIAVHLLVRQHVRTLAYPSLRFLRETQLAAFRRRSIQDASLLLCRIVIIALAAMALAGPVFQTGARAATEAARVSRAIVIIESAPAELITRLGENVFASRTVQRSHIGDALADAVRWLNQQPRSAREIVVAGALRRGAIDAIDFQSLPPEIGVRFEPISVQAAARYSMPVLVRRNGALQRVDRAITLTADGTQLIDGTATPVRSDLVSITAAPADAALAEAALRAALSHGVPWTDFDRQVMISLPAGTEPAESADVVLAMLTKIGAQPRIEPELIPSSQLESWSRPPGSPSNDAPVADEGDRRWIWALVLMLLGVEWWMRRARTDASEHHDRQAEARVA